MAFATATYNDSCLTYMQCDCCTAVKSECTRVACAWWRGCHVEDHRVKHLEIEIWWLDPASSWLSQWNLAPKLCRVIRRSDRGNRCAGYSFCWLTNSDKHFWYQTTTFMRGLIWSRVKSRPKIVSANFEVSKVLDHQSKRLWSHGMLEPTLSEWY